MSTAERYDLLSIFFPMWNEEQYIDRALDEAIKVCQELRVNDMIGDYELIVVNDASTDATGQIADRRADSDEHIRVVHHQHNRKLGGAIKSGFAAARGDIVLYADADLPFEMREIVKAIRLMRCYQASMVSAYRFDRTGEGPIRAIYTFAYNALIRAFFGTRLRDINFAFKLVHRRLLAAITLKSEGSFIDAELAIRANRMGFDVVQFGVDYFPRTRGISTLSSPRVIMKIIREMVELRSELAKLGKRP